MELCTEKQHRCMTAHSVAFKAQIYSLENIWTHCAVYVVRSMTECIQTFLATLWLNYKYFLQHLLCSFSPKMHHILLSDFARHLNYLLHTFYCLSFLKEVNCIEAICPFTTYVNCKYIQCFEKLCFGRHHENKKT